MNNMIDYYLYVNWEDNQKNIYRIGILARIADTYYLKLSTPKNNYERDAYCHGYAGIPGFISDRLYTSTNQLFDFFKKRVFVPHNMESTTDFLAELIKTNGSTLTDSFSIEEIPEKYRANYKNIILSLDALEQEKSKLEEDLQQN